MLSSRNPALQELMKRDNDLLARVVRWMELAFRPNQISALPEMLVELGQME